MSDFFPKTEETFPIEGGNEVTLRLLTFEERMIATGRARSRSSGDDQAAYIFLRLEMTKLSLVAWRGPAFKNVKCTEENIGKLAIGIGSEIADLVMTLNLPPVENEDEDEDGLTEKKE